MDNHDWGVVEWVMLFLFGLPVSCLVWGLCFLLLMDLWEDR